jgi:hypothetical protein
MLFPGRTANFGYTPSTKLRVSRGLLLRIGSVMAAEVFIRGELRRTAALNAER